MGHLLNGYRLCQKQSELGDFEERSPIIRGIRYAVIFAGTGTWRPSRRALYYPSRACTMNVGIKMFGSSAVNSCPGSPALVLAVQVALLYTVIAGRADCRARVRTATRKSYRLVERLTKKKIYLK